MKILFWLAHTKEYCHHFIPPAPHSSLQEMVWQVHRNMSYLTSSQKKKKGTNMKGRLHLTKILLFINNILAISAISSYETASWTAINKEKLLS